MSDYKPSTCVTTSQGEKQDTASTLESSRVTSHSYSPTLLPSPEVTTALTLTIIIFLLFLLSVYTSLNNVLARMFLNFNE